MSKILPYVPDLEEQRQIKAQLAELNARRREDLEESVEAGTVQILKKGKVLELRGYDFEMGSSVDFKIPVTDWPRTVIEKVCYSDVPEECEGVFVRGYLLA